MVHSRRENREIFPPLYILFSQRQYVEKEGKQKQRDIFRELLVEDRDRYVRNDPEVYEAAFQYR